MFKSPPSPEMIKQIDTGYIPFPTIDKVAAITEYRNPNEPMNIGHMALERVSYFYFDDRLFKIDIAFLKDSICTSARDIVPSIEAQYKIKLKQFSDVTKLDMFLAQAKEADIRITSNCWREKNDWVSSLTIDYMPGYIKAEEAAKQIENRRQQMKIQLERKDL